MLHYLGLPILFLLQTCNIFSQTCELDKTELSSSFSIYPSKTENLGHARVKGYYEETISFKFPNSTSEILETDIIDCPSYLPKGVTVRDIEITNIEGLPEGIAYVCDEENCYWKEATFGAVCLFGSPSFKGEYELTVKVEGVANVLFLPITVACTLTGYKISVQ